MGLTRPVVIKVGGSLIKHAPGIIAIIREAFSDLLIIPGGGIFADTVRMTGAVGTCAHWMAIAAMDQYGWYLSEFGLPVTTNPVFTGKPCILLPYRHLLEVDPLEHTWDISSDTISTYFAHLLSAPLFILKSIEYVRSNGHPVDILKEDLVTEDLDKKCIEFIFSHDLQGCVILGSDINRLAALLNGEIVPGTWFGSTI